MRYIRSTLMAGSRVLLCISVLCLLNGAVAQQRPGVLRDAVQQHLLGLGFHADDLAELEIRDQYTSAHNGVTHTFLRQRWHGIEVWNGDVAVHQAADGSILRINNGARRFLGKRTNTTDPVLTPGQALAEVLGRNLPGIPVPSVLASSDMGRHWTYDGALLGGETAVVQLVWQPMGDSLRLAWNVNHYTPDGSHWWNVRVDAVSGDELERNDWVSQCAFGENTTSCSDHQALHPEAEGEGMWMAPNDCNVFAWPTESPTHGPRTIQNAPWSDGGIASPYGWHDTNGAPGAEFTDTRGNNVFAQEDADANNTGGFRPNGGVGLDLNFPINFTQQPVNYQSAAITNLFYWNNVLHDMIYQYGFDEPSGNFQQNNYGRGGAQNDRVNADALDGSGTNNANFATPPDGTAPRMQMFVWTQTNPNRTSDLDNGVIAHEYAHGISNRLVAGPGNVNCLGNAEQMGEGWSDYFALMTTLKAGDLGTTGRGIGTYLLGQPVTGLGIRPARYSTNFGVNNVTYGATNNTAAISQPHGIGFVWCTILWEMTWELIDTHGLDPDLYNGAGGNNIAMQLVVDGMKLTPCNPGFVDARDAILLADQINNAGANQNLLWAAFARRGLGASASQGSSAVRTDQVQAFDMPMANNVGIAEIISPTADDLLACDDAPINVIALVRNFGSQPQSNFPVRYRLDGGPFVTTTFTATLASGTSALYTFPAPVVISDVGAHTVEVSTNLPGDQFAGDNSQNVALQVIAGTTLPAPFFEGLSAASPTPPGWRINNPDNGITWSTGLLANGPACNNTRVWFLDHYSYSATGQEDMLITPMIDLSDRSDSRLRFHHAYARYNATYSDAFRVDISANCGGNWTTVFAQAGAVLATAPNNVNAWVPTSCAQWRLNDIDISQYDGQMILVRFVAINGFGNQFYMDDVEIDGEYASPLPVELLRFDARTESEGIRLDWTTATEFNTDRFDVQRSTDLLEWKHVNSVPAAGYAVMLNEYDMLDDHPEPGTNFYRLHMIDLDGRAAFSPTVSADWDRNGPALWPNPNSGTFTLSGTNAHRHVVVHDALGRPVPYRWEAGGEGRLVLHLDGASGIYLVRIGTGEGAFVERVMVLDH